MAADQIDLATKSAIYNIQKYCVIKAAPEQKNMMEEIVKKIQDLMKKKEEDSPAKKQICIL